MKLANSAMLIALVLMTSGCNNRNPVNTNDNPQNSIQTEKSSLVRNTNPGVSQSQIDEIVSDNNNFAVDLYKELASGDQNVFFSPFSISMALAMTYGGARNETANEMKKVLHFTLNDTMVHVAFNSLDLKLRSQSSVKLAPVNQAWGRGDVKFQAGYLDLLAVNYGSEMRILDFARDPEGSRLTINGWVADNTNNKILELLPKGSIGDLTALVLTNAIYFLGDWHYQFNNDLTTDKSFFLENGTSVNVPMMSFRENGEKIKLNYTRTQYCTAVELPYKGDNISMVVVLPSDSNLTKFEHELTKERIAEITSGFYASDLYVELPRFSFTSNTIRLKNALQKLGMEKAFTEGADFSGIAGPDYPMAIGDVYHKAYIKVDEKGTEAAAATAVVVVVTTTNGPDKHSFIADRPFFFMIRDRVSNSILFMGRITDPSVN